MEQDLPGASARQPDPLRLLPVRRPLVICRPTHFYLVEPLAVRVVIHWDDQRNRSSICRMDSGAALCDGCDWGTPRRVVWYVQVWAMSQRGPVELLVLTASGIGSCPRLVAPDGLLPGAVILTGRVPEKPSGRQYVRVERADPPSALPHSYPTLEVVERLFARPDRPDRPDRAPPPVKRPRLYPPPAPPEESDPLMEGL